ncbi:MAG: rod shape-determining protein RodA [Paludibacteraceae bacterium]|nr:rod shape-determining protein RodA [Paludibacteraceae bacterium]MBQ9296420.1 rod shape-determining protein RodA [Paludibacteraceae bacterium]
MRASRNGNILQHVDWQTIGIFLVLVLFGWLNIYGASYTFDQTSIFDFSNRAGKQFAWILGSLVLGGVLLMIDYKTYDVLAYIAYGAMLLLLLATPFLARDIKGSLSWISLGPVSLQPAEFAKCIVALTIAKYMSRYEYKVRTWRDLIVPFLIIGVPCLIIMILQKETGSALVFAAFLLVFYRQGMSGYILWCGVAAVALFIISIRFGTIALPLGSGSVGILSCMLLLTAVEIYFVCKEHHMRYQALILSGSVAVIYGICLLINIWWSVPFNWVATAIVVGLAVYTAVVSVYFRKYRLLLVTAFSIVCIGYTQACDFVFTRVLQPHQRIRIEVLLGMKEDPAGAGYNVNQARIAIGSGRFFGKGYLKGTQTKLQFVPEQDTDFIFCTVGEEWGFVGSVAVLLVYLYFILRLILIAERQRSTFTQIYAYAVAGIFLFHLTINVGMVLGLLPVIGIPLPFFSYGGSSLWGFTLLLFILLRLDAARMEQLR